MLCEINVEMYTLKGQNLLVATVVSRVLQKLAIGAYNNTDEYVAR